MKFSMIFEAQMADPTRGNEHQVIRDCVEQAVFAEEMGFDRVWAVEHHCLKWYAHMSAPEIFLTWVAARPSRIRIGHGVVCMPFNYNHPIRVAERAAMLDVLSNGRLDLGAGRGATLQEMSAVRRRPRPHVRRGRRGAAHDRRDVARTTTSSSGTASCSTGRRPHPILPRPVQMPHPPLFLACTKRDTVDARRRVRHRRARARLRRPRRDRRAAQDLRRRDRDAHRRAVRVDRGQRPLLRAVPDDRARRRATRRSRSARAASGSSPRRSRTGTAAAPPPEPRTPSADDNVAEIEQRRGRGRGAAARGEHPGQPELARARSTLDHAYGDWRRRDRLRRAARETPAPTRSCA